MIVGIMGIKLLVIIFLKFDVYSNLLLYTIVTCKHKTENNGE